MVRGQEVLLEEVPLGRAVDVVLLGCRRVAWGGHTCGPAGAAAHAPPSSLGKESGDRGPGHTLPSRKCRSTCVSPVQVLLSDTL